MPEFAEPLWLLLLLLVPAVVWIGRRRDAGEARFKRVAGDALRCLAIAALVVALAGPLKGSYPRHTDLVFALDVSGSIDPDTAQRALSFVNRAFEREVEDSRTGLVVFGADAAVEVFLRRGAEPVREISVEVPRDGTDIGRALEVAMGAFASDGHRRVVMLSDGRETLGSARSAAAVARSLGVEIAAIPLVKDESLDEVQVEGIQVPSRVRANEPFEVQVMLNSKTGARAHVVLLRDGEVLREETLRLVPGDNVFSVVEQAADAGLMEYEAIVNSDADRVLENNRHQAFVRVRGAPKVLHVVGRAESSRFVTGALEAQGLRVEERPAVEVPATLHELVEYDLIVLNNVSGFDLSIEKMERLESYVRDAGGGLVMLGGDQSYSAGGYYETPVERLLPVTMDVKTQVKIPSLAVIFVIDKSGSMSSWSHGEEKLGTAKVAALAAIEVLNPLDRVAVLAFDAEHEWAVPPTEVGNWRAIAEQLRLLAAGGSTDLLGALEEAHREMREQPAKVKHLIVLSDGLSDTAADYDGLARRINADGITISTVSLGTDADRLLMAGIASHGKGRFYHTEDPRNIPRIFTSETLVVSRALLVEGRIQPVGGYPGEMLEGFDPDAMPPLGGYQRTYPKPAAQVLLGAAEEDPLLVSWRYGLGKSVAFTSDLSGRWGREWVTWPGFGRFVAQMARATMRHSGTETMVPTFKWHDRRAEVSIDVLDSDERFINGLTMEATVVGPRGEPRAVDFEQVAPGRYRGDFEALPAGRYYVNVQGTSDEHQVGPETFGLALPYSAEYVDAGVDHDHLRDLAEATGGAVLPLASGSLDALYAPPARAPGPRWRVWWPFLLAALVLLIIEVAVRKLSLPRSWSQRVAAWRGRTSATDEAEPDYETLSASITAARARHIAALRDEVNYRPDDPAVRARLYVAGFRRGGR